MVDYTFAPGQPGGTGSVSTILGGSLQKSALREYIYTETLVAAIVGSQLDVTAVASGTTSTLTFFGTGIVLHASYTTSASVTVEIDGVAYTGSATIGTAITCSGNDTTNGTIYTINEAGVYAISIQDTRSGAVGGTIGVSLNSSAVTTSITSITNVNILAFATNGVANEFISASVTIRLTIGDVIRPHCDGNLDGSDSARFTITQVAKT